MENENKVTELTPAANATKPKRKPLRKPSKAGGLKKIAQKKTKKTKKVKRVKGAARKTRLDLSKRYRVKGGVKPDGIRSRILQVMVKTGKKLKTFDAERLNKAVGKHLPTKSKERQRSVIAWRLRHSGLFQAAA